MKCIINFEKRKYPVNVSFLGTYQKNRLELLESISKFHPKIWGYHWNKVKLSTTTTASDAAESNFDFFGSKKLVNNFFYSLYFKFLTRKYVLIKNYY